MTRLHVTIATADERVEESGNKMKEDENKIRDDALTEFRKRHTPYGVYVGYIDMYCLLQYYTCIIRVCVCISSELMSTDGGRLMLKSRNYCCTP